jgi:LacI family fructose operon transcriptional repressor
MVLIDRTAPGMAHDSVVLDNEAMAARLVEHLHERGFTSIAGLFGADSTTGPERRAGFEQAARRLGLGRSHRRPPWLGEADRPSPPCWPRAAASGADRQQWRHADGGAARRAPPGWRCRAIWR